MDKNQEIKFLEDKALMNITSDKLGHKSIAKTLQEIIQICPLPFTIGLFGNWGTGKSTIANFLVDKLKKLNEKNKKDKTAIIEFDVWKYEKDSLRRQFILNLERTLKEDGFLDKKYKIDPRVEHSTTRSFEGKVTLSKKGLSINVFYIGAIVLIVLLSLIAFGISKLASQFLPSYLGSVLTPIFSGVTFFFILQIASKVITSETETWTSDKFKDPDEFEEVFEDIVEKASAKKILVIFDNLDRTTDKKAIELLSTIKTFLEPKTNKCIFLIQCDETAIKKHLKNLYKNYNDGDTDEFLRKFFNTFIKIPPFIDVDLEAYVREMLKQTGIEALYSNNDLVTVIVKGFRENPRQIKQFINMFISHYLLAVQREGGKKPIINKGTITKAPASLGKLLVIRQKWYSEYEKVIDDPKTLNTSMPGPVGAYMIATSSIPIADIRALIYFKKSSSQLALSGFEDSLRIALEDFKEDEVGKIVQEAKIKRVKDEEIGRFIIELFDLNKDQSQNLINIVNLTGNLGIVISKELGEKASEVVDRKLGGQLGSLKVFSVINLIKATRKTYDHRKQVIEAYLHLLSEGKNAQSTEQYPNYADLSEHLVQLILDNMDIFSEYKEGVAESLEKGHFDNQNILELFKGRIKSIKAFITTEFLSKFVDSIPIPSTDKPETFSETALNKSIDLALSLDLDATAEVGTIILRKMDALVTTYLGAMHPDREKYFWEVLRYIELVLDRYTSKIEQDASNHLGDTLQQVISTFGEYPKKAGLILPITNLTSLVSEDKNKNLQQTLRAFFQGVDVETLKNFLEQNGQVVKAKLFMLVREVLEDRAVGDSNMVEILWPFENAEEKRIFLAKMVDKGDYNIALEKLEAIHYRVNNKVDIAKKLFDKATSLEVTQRPILYGAINKLKCGSDKELKEQYITQLQSLIVNQPRQTQEIGFGAYNEASSLGFLFNSQRLNFATPIIEWLNSLGTIGLDHEFALRAVVLDFRVLSITHKDNLLNCIFDKMIAKTGVVEEINLGFDLIYLLGGTLKYDKNNQQHFDVVYSRLETEPDLNLKKLIATGFGKIRPPRILKFSKTFWGRIRKIQNTFKP